MGTNRTNWLGVELRHFAALAAVQRHGSFRAAASNLGYVQSAVSQQIARLEQLVGSRLVERTRGAGNVTLTPAGEVLLAHAEAILSELQAARADLAALVGGGSAALRVGVFHSAATRLMPNILRELARRAPDLRVIPRESATDTALFALVEEGALDVAFGDLPLEPGPFEWCELMSDPCVMLVEAGSELDVDRAREPSLARIAGMPLIKQPGWRMSARIETELRATGTEPRFVLASDTDAAVQPLVAAGIGSAIVRGLAVDRPQPGTATLELRALPPARVALFWHERRHANAALRVFREVACDVCDHFAANR
jgi:molybdate transport repressor ModE-like protein